MKILGTKEELLKKLDQRKDNDNEEYLKIVKKIIEDIKTRGDEALLEYTNRFDSLVINKNNIKVSDEEIINAYNSIDNELKSAYKTAKERIFNFHEHQKEKTWMYKNGGEVLGQKITPIENVGIYVPGGKAAYPSTVFMDAIPAIVAGVKKIIMTTPCNKDGRICDEVLAAAHILGIKDIYKCGGAQAIAAMALGTLIIPKVDKIVGPGNIFVALAKKEMFGSVSIDSVAGPSEILVIADKSANYKFVAADLLSQAEHDEMASSILLTDSEELALKVIKQIDIYLQTLERSEIIKKSIENYSGIVITKNIDEAIEISNCIAPEHLELAIEKPFGYLNKIINAGAVFLGNYATEPLGDYMAGPNHVLPTMRTARFFSPLSVYDFVKKTSIIFFDQKAFSKIADKIDRFARGEGLTAHALAVTVRLDENNKKMKYLRSDLKDKVPYHNNRMSDGIVMDANESAFETPKKIIELVKNELDNIDLRRYPDTDNTLVRNELAKAYDINIKNITVGVGSDQLLDCVFRSLIDDEYVLSCNPTFSMYKEYASYTNGKFIDIDFLPNFVFDIKSILDNIEKVKPKLIIICSPNNPTGSVIKRSDLELIINKTNGIVLLDEAYSEFYKSNYDLGIKYKNVIVLKTFSKAYALAGIRLGYAISSEDLIDTINVCRPPYNISSLSSLIASVAIKNRDLYDDNIKKIIELKDELYNDLCTLGLNPCKSWSNFIFVKLNNKIYEHLIERKIYIRRIKYNNEFWHRITVGSKKENKILVQAVKEVL